MNKRLGEQAASPGNITDFSFSSDFGYSMFYGESNSRPVAFLLDNRTGKAIASWPDLVAENVRWNPQRPELAIRDDKGTVWIIAAATGEVKATADVPLTGTPDSMADMVGAAMAPDLSYSHDGSSILVAAGDHVKRLDSATLKETMSLPTEPDQTGEWFDHAWATSDGRFVGTSRYNDGYHQGDPVFSETRIWNAITGRFLFAIPEAGYAISPDGRQLITMSGAVWPLLHIAKLARFDEELATSVIGAISSDGRYIAVSDGSPNILVRDADSLAIKAKLSLTTGGEKTILFAPAGTHVVAFTKGGAADVYDVGRDQREFSPILTMTSLIAAQFDDNGERLVTAHEDGELRIWDLASRTPARTIRIADGKPRSAALSRDGLHLAVTLEDNTVRAFNLADGREIWRHALDGPLVNFNQDVILTSEDMRFFTTEFSHDGRQVAASSGAYVSIFDTATGEQLRLFKEHGCPVRRLQFTENDEAVVSSSSDQLGIIWQARDGQLLGKVRPQRQGSPVELCAGKQDENVSISVAGRIVVYSGRQIVNDYSLPLDYRELLATGKKQALSCLTTDERKEFFLDQAPPRWCYAMKKWPFEEGPPQGEDTSATPAGGIDRLWKLLAGYFGR